MPHGIFMTVLLGFVVGLIAKFVMGGREPSGFFATVCIGIAGSLLGNYLGRSFGHATYTPNASLLMSLLGACILLAIYHLLTRSRSRF
jgi:uncharacterized membrane protein YeaQ/YmgE (transglycosylase-associated protein family)